MKSALVLAAIAALPLAASGAPRPRIAVLDVRGVQGVSPGTATILTAIVVDDASRAGFDVISQSDVSAMIGFEKQKQMLGCRDDSSCLAEIGGALGVDYVLSGQVGQIGSRLHLSFQLLDARKAKVIARAARFSDRDEDALASAAQAAVAELLSGREAARQAAQAQAEKARQAEAPAKVEPRPEQAKRPPEQKVAASPARQPEKADLAARPQAGGAERPRWSFFRSRKAAYWTMGAGGAVFLAGAVTGLVAKRRYDRLDSRSAELGYYDAYLSEKAGIRRLAVAADAMMLTGLAASSVGGVAWWRSRHRSAALSAAPLPGGAALVAAGTF